MSPVKSRRQRSAHTSPKHERRWRFSRFSLIPALLGLLGMLAFTYPTAASWMSQYNQSKIVADYSSGVDNVDPDAATQIAQAHDYNDALSVGALLEANTHVPTGAGTSGGTDLDYNAILNANGAGLMARLRIPSIDLDLPVYHGTSDQTLLEGLGHLEGTSLPVGGVGTRSVITGHRGLANATMFTNLDKVGEGDTFTAEVFGEVLTYRVVETKVVEPEQTEELRADPDRDLMTLVTCTPLGVNTHRILVTGERIPTPDDTVAGERPDVPKFPWWAVALAAGIVLDGLYVWRAGYPARSRSRSGSGSRAASASGSGSAGGSPRAFGRRRGRPRDTPERVSRVGGLTDG